MVVLSPRDHMLADPQCPSSDMSTNVVEVKKKNKVLRPLLQAINHKPLMPQNQVLLALTPVTCYIN
jgi:hypothetical protein